MVGKGAHLEEYVLVLQVGEGVVHLEREGVHLLGYLDTCVVIIRSTVSRIGDDVKIVPPVLVVDPQVDVAPLLSLPRT